MTRANWDEVNRLFLAGSELSPGDRTTYVREAAPDGATASEAISLLRHASATDFLGTEVLGPAGNVDAVAGAVFRVLEAGERVQRYVVLGLVGQGGMSTVYAAEQDSPRRIVAIKVPAVDRVAQAWTASRFQHEASCLGQLRHEGIAQIYEAGVEELADGCRRPYIAMEYVPGARRITAHCVERGMGMAERARLLARVCRAIHHGHQRGIVHLDLKPSNILVDEGGNPKVIDFGVSRTSRTVGLEMEGGGLEDVACGTPQYMSPEQFESGKTGVDVRSDVYSLGVVLYEMLVGAVPYEVRGLAAERALEVMRGVDVEVGLGRKGVAQDLGAIVGTAMALDPEGRYSSASAMADDLEAFASRRPLRSRRVGLGRRGVLWGRRHPIACVAGGMGLMVGVWGGLQIVRSEMAARRADRAATTVLSLMKDMLTSPKVRGRADIRFVEVLDDSAARLDVLTGISAEAAEEMHATLAESYDLVGRYREAERHYGRAAELAGEAYGVESERTIERLMGRAGSCFDLGRLEEARAILERVWGVVRERHGEGSLAAARVLNEQGLILFFEGRHGEAEAIHRRVLRVYADRLGSESVESAQALHNLGVSLLHQGKVKEAEGCLVECLRLTKSHAPTLHAATPRVRRWLAVVLASEGRLEDAQRECDVAMTELRALVGEEHPFVAGILDSMAFVSAGRGDRTGAEVLLTRSIELLSRAQGEDHPYTTAGLAKLENLRAGNPLLGTQVLSAEPPKGRGLGERE